jgi:hypothetical protein
MAPEEPCKRCRKLLRRGEECHVARPGEGTQECAVHDGAKGCPACRLRLAEAEVERLRGERDDSDLALAETRLSEERLRGLLGRWSETTASGRYRGLRLDTRAALRGEEGDDE